MKRVLDEGDTLDRLAFGFAVGDVLLLAPEQIGVQYEGDLENVAWAIRKAGGPLRWAKTVKLRTPIEVLYKKGRFWIEDGHHRWTAAKILGKKLRARVVRIDDNPLLAIERAQTRAR